MLALILMLSLLCRSTEYHFTGHDAKTMLRLWCNSKRFIQSLESIRIRIRKKSNRLGSTTIVQKVLAKLGWGRQYCPHLKTCPDRSRTTCTIIIICLSPRSTINSSGCNIESALLSLSCFTIFTIAEIFLRLLQTSTSPNT